MIIYRPHRGSLSDAMLEAKEFETIDEMKNYIVKEWNEFFTVDDIVIDETRTVPDERIGWENTMYVCVKQINGENYIEKYGTAQCIGMCATRYKKPWCNNRGDAPMFKAGDCVRIKATGFTKIIVGIDLNDSTKFLVGTNPIIGDPTMSSYREDELEKVDKMDHSQDFNGNTLAIISIDRPPCPLCQEKALIRVDNEDNYCKYRLIGKDLVVNHYDHDAYTYSFPVNFCHLCGRPITV